MLRHGAGLNNTKPVDEVVAEARKLADAGFRTLSSSHIFSYDALSLLQAVGSEVDSVELMTAVVPIYTRHPFAMAQQALSVQAATGGRLVLGIGLSHQVVVENIYGTPFRHPLKAMEEYLAVLLPLLEGGRASVSGEHFSSMGGPIEIEASRPPVIIAALGQAMLELAGARADGTATWMTGRKTLAEHTVPTIRAAAERAGRPEPRIMAALPVCVTDDPGPARQKADETFVVYGSLPSYRAMLDREGASGPGEAALVGTEEEVAEQIEEVAAAGVTDFTGAPFGSREEVTRTRAFLAGLT